MILPLPEMPPVTPRRPYLEDGPEGYREGDRDFVLNNLDACVWFLEHHDYIRTVIKEKT